MSVLIVAEHDGSALNPATLSCVSAAALIGGNIDILVAGHDCRAVADEAARIAGVSRVRLADSEACAHQLAENLAPLVQQLATDYGHVLAAATRFGKDLMPRVAALLDVAQLSDISAVESADTFQRPIYAGSVIATVQSTDPIKVVTVRPTSFEPVAAEGGSADVDDVDLAVVNSGLSAYIGERLTKLDRPDLAAAEIVVSGGRGMGSGENFALLERIADRLGAAIDVSRDVVDAEFVPNDYQVGQTGKVVAPKLYLAVGISGAIQHLAGMKDSKVIVAINKDEEAPIFQIADYGIVDDLFKVLPELAEELEKTPTTA